MRVTRLADTRGFYDGSRRPFLIIFTQQTQCACSDTYPLRDVGGSLRGREERFSHDRTRRLTDFGGGWT